MAFIDIFNFKKYFTTPSDSQVARYGHVNALYNATQPKFTVDTVTQIGNAFAAVTINSTAGKITMAGITGLNNSTGFVVNNTTVTSNSIILLTALPTDTDKGKEIILTCSNVGEGVFTITSQLAGTIPAATVNPISINFLVINP